MNILSDVSRVIAPLLALYGIFRAVDLINRDATQYLWMWREETLSFWLEIALLVVVPLVLLNLQTVRNNPLYLYWTNAVMVAGFMANRLNVSITALQANSARLLRAEVDGVRGHVGDIAAAIVAFRYAVIYLDILPKNPPRERWMVPSAPAQA